jgi:hypothetical protein
VLSYYWGGACVSRVSKDDGGLANVGIEHNTAQKIYDSVFKCCIAEYTNIPGEINIIIIYATGSMPPR